jgi:dodecin
MADHVYKTIELTGTSTTSMEDAVRTAISKASKSLHGLHWFQVTDTRGLIEKNAVAKWQVTVKVGFTLDD